MANQPANQIERRVFSGDVRAKRAEAGPTVLSGYAAVFGQETVIDGFWPFREVIQAGAFGETIQTDDVRGLFNHDANHVLGRTSNGTLRLSEDGLGLHYEIDLNAADPDAVSVGAKVERGDVSQSSFAFQVAEDTWDESEVKAGKLPLRTIVRVSPLYDVSPVTFPAYATTTVGARAEARAKELTERTLPTPGDPVPPVVADPVPPVAVNDAALRQIDYQIAEWELRRRERHAR